MNIDLQWGGEEYALAVLQLITMLHMVQKYFSTYLYPSIKAKTSRLLNPH